MSDRRVLEGRTVLVTGGNGGIGIEVARACLRAGAQVVAWGTNAEKNAAAAEELAPEGRVFVQRCDVSDEDDVRTSFAEAVEEMGTIDAAFANAAISHFARLTDTSLEDWRRVMAVNLDGVFLTLREAARFLKARGEGGALVAVSSPAAFFGAADIAAYGTAKTGVLGMVRALAVELAKHRIRVNSLIPGWTTTEITESQRGNEVLHDAITARIPMRRWASPSEMGPAAVFLADPTNEFHTGDSIVVDGGFSIY